MTGESKDVEAFLKALGVLAGLVKFDLTDDICMFYAQSLKPYGLEKARQAIIKLARSSKVGRGLPSVDEILEIVAPQEVAKISDQENAAVIAGRIEEALTRYGSRNASKGFPEAEKFIGEIGWAVVGQRWLHICDTTTNSQLPTLKSQWRQEVQGAIARAKALMPEAPALPPGVKAKQIEINEAKKEPEVNESVSKIINSSMNTIDMKSRASGEREDDW